MSIINPTPIRPFSKQYTTGASPGSQVVTLTDSAGNPIQCNYIQVSLMASINNNSYFLVEPSGVSDYPAVTLGNSASGTLGMVGSVADPVEMFLPNADMCSALTVSIYNNTTALGMGITYGVMTPYNKLSSFGRNRGG